MSPPRPTEKPDWSAGHAFAEGRPQRIARMLSERITHHELQPGAKLPSENALAAHFGVSRAAVREAIAMLKAEGLVETLQGSGAYVRAPDAASHDDALDGLTRASVGSLLDLIEVRRVMEGEIAAKAAATRTPAQLAAIDEALARLRRAQLDGRPGVVEDRAFHASIAEASNNAYWRKLTDALAKSVEIAISVTRLNESLRRDFAIAVDDEHSAVRDAIAAGDPERARAAAALHMQKSAERVLSADQEFWIKDGSRIIDLPSAT
jgi:GntR family transcriptional regulator, transcriptional repressor for pyruvate dehydrogenase complex